MRRNSFLLSEQRGYLSQDGYGKQILDSIVAPNGNIGIPFNIGLTRDTKAIVVGCTVALSVALLAVAFSNSKSK